ncbi:hypothetical protein PIECOFPK_02385 [Mycovorax composti]|jgi:hypothetical protein|uniref:Outer membrane protein beta-barrel domain-containing protein n=2 Tax=Chitinophagaceae TaxID=563835 RepID=A0ABZ2EN27_9BACT
MSIVRYLLIGCIVFFCINVASAQIRTKQEKGYFNITNLAEIQYLQSLDSSSLEDGLAYVKTFGYSVSTINGFFVNNHLSIGVGVGLQTSRYKAFAGSSTTDSAIASGYFGKNHNITLLPVFADFRYYPFNYRNDVMFLLNVGYAPLLKINYKADKPHLNGGPFIKLGAGYKFEISEFVSFAPAINFNAQRFGDNTVLGGGIALGLMF